MLKYSSIDRENKVEEKICLQEEKNEKKLLSNNNKR
jgi:hypothetical protein